MLKKEQVKTIEEEIKKFFEKLGIEVDLEIGSFKESVLSVNIKTKENQFLIGEKGETLFEIQHLLNAIFKKKFNGEFSIDLDVLNYKKKKIEFLKELAKSVADEVSLTKKEKILEPMPAFERKIIHLELASRPDVTTESIGKEPKRRVVIKPYP